MSRLLPSVFLALALYLCWELAARSFDALQFVLPPPSAIVLGLWDHADRFLLHSVVTLREMLGGLLLSLVVAIPLAGTMVVWRRVRELAHPLIVLSQCLPMFALAPLMVIWFGWSYASVIIPTALMTFVPLTLSFYQGLMSVPQDYLDAFQLYGATTWQTFWKLRLPWALPNLSTGLRIAASFAGLGAVAGEWAGGQQGLGLLMLESRRGADLVTAFGAIFCLIVLSLMLYSLSSALERLASLKRPLSTLWAQSHSRRSLLGLMVLLMMMVTASSWEIAPRAKLDSSVRLILDWVPNPNHVPLFFGDADGIFLKHGINLQILTVHDPGDVIPYLTSGQADIAVTYMSSVLLGAQQRGADLAVAGYLIKEPLNCLIFRADKEVTCPADLSGKVIGCATDGIQTQLLNRILALNHVIPTEMPNINFDVVPMFLTERVDALFGAYHNIEVETLCHNGVKASYFGLEQLGVPRHFELVLVAKRNGTYAESDFLQRFRSALQESIVSCISEPERAFGIYALANPDKTATTLQWEQKAWRRTLDVLAKHQGDEMPVWRAYYEWLQQQGLVITAVDFKGLLMSEMD